MTTETRVEQLKSEIETLEPMEGTAGLVSEKKAELAKLEGSAVLTAKKKGDKGMTEEGVIELPSTEDDWNKASSKFAAPGLHLSEMGMPYVKTPGRSIGFPFTIVEDGPDNGREGEIFGGMDANSVWKTKEILNAVGVAHQVVNGKIQFKPADCMSKEFMSLWTQEKDTRTPEEGGKGTIYTKATKAVKVGAEITDLGIEG